MTKRKDFRKPQVFDDGIVECHSCGEAYTQISVHWSGGTTCDHPPLTDVQFETIVGCLMGDGTVGARGRKNQRLKIKWSSKKQCKWLDSEFGWLSTGVFLKHTAEEAARQLQENIGGSSTVEDCSAQYVVQTRSHPEITKLTSWYSSGKKVWPGNLDLTPTTLLLWFVGDGHYNDSGTSRRISIGMYNEADNTEKVYKYFDRKNLPRPSSDGGGGHPHWTVEGSRTLFRYMNRSPLYGPPDGFKYKFPSNMGGTGKEL